MLWIYIHAEVVYIRPHQEQYLASEEFEGKCLSHISKIKNTREKV